VTLSVPDLPNVVTSGHNIFMANASYLRVTKSETRDLADREYRARVLGRSEEWSMSNGAFFAAFVAIAGVIALLALVLR
jgi:hypothetical protein